MKLLIINAHIINADTSIEADILCDNGKIIKIDTNLSTEGIAKTIDASGCYVFPGGIDPHVHMHLPSHAGYSADDFSSGSKVALLGGTTTLIDFVTPKKGQSLTNALVERRDEAVNSLIDYSFHVSPIEWRDTTEQEIKDCIKAGITSFKIYMAYKKAIGIENEIISKVMKVVGESGGLVTAHCELGDEIEILRENFAKEGKLSPEFHPLSRPANLEAEAVKEFIEMGKEANCPVYVVHVSAKESLNHIYKAQQQKQKVFAETCPQYLLLEYSKYQGDFSQTAPFVMSPPLRKKADNKAIWDAITEETIQTIGTDHCPFTLQQKEFGKDDFRKIPNGAGGVEHRLTLLFTYGVLENKISLNQFVNSTSTQAAKIFGIYPQKGVVQVGSDADLVIWNPKQENTISAKTHHTNCDSDIYEGFKTKGQAKYVITNGKVVVKEGELISKISKGAFLRRNKLD